MNFTELRRDFKKTDSLRYAIMASLMALPFALSACRQEAPTASEYPDRMATSSCAAPLAIAHSSALATSELTPSERADLVMSATGRAFAESDIVCDAAPSVKAYQALGTNADETPTAYVKFEASQTPTPKSDLMQSELAKTTQDRIRAGQCEQAWNDLTPLIAAGSSEASGVLWGAMTNVFSTDDPGKNNGLIASGMSAFGLTGKEFDLSLAVASLPSGPNDIYLGTDPIKARVGRYLNVQLEDIVTGSDCDFTAPSFACRELALQRSRVKPIRTFSGFLTDAHPEKSIICNRRF